MQFNDSMSAHAQGRRLFKGHDVPSNASLLGSAAAPRPPSVNLSPRADVPAAGRGEARHSYTRRQPSLYRVPQERMRAVLSPSRAPVKLCAAHAQDPEGCTDRFCTYSHASKEERFCMQFFDEDEMGVGPGCRFGALRCFFGHGEASRAVYRAYRSTIDYV